MGNWCIGISGIYNDQLIGCVKYQLGLVGIKVVNGLLCKFVFKGIN